PGTVVRRAEGKERDQALYFDQMAVRLPIGLGRDKQPLFANLEFLDGRRGAHVNISGISGGATKTTYATFLLYSLFTSGVLGAESVNTKALIFNVKGEDLLFLDHLNRRLPQQARDADVATRTTGVDTYYWTLAEFCDEELLPFVFAEAEDDRHQYTMLIYYVAGLLKRDGSAQGDDGAWQLDGEVLRTYHDLVELIVD